MCVLIEGCLALYFGLYTKRQARASKFVAVYHSTCSCILCVRPAVRVLTQRCAVEQSGDVAERSMLGMSLAITRPLACLLILAAATLARPVGDLYSQPASSRRQA